MPLTDQRLYRLCRFLHRDHLGKDPPRASLHRPGGHGVLQVRRYHERGESRDAQAVSLKLAHQVQPVSIGQSYVYQRGVQPVLLLQQGVRPRNGVRLGEGDVELGSQFEF
jgi:hypothetical protein